MNETEYTTNAIRCLERSQELKSPDHARLNVAQAAVWASLAQNAQLTRIADALERAYPAKYPTEETWLRWVDAFMARAGARQTKAEEASTCACGADDCGSDHSDDCPCYPKSHYAPED